MNNTTTTNMGEPCPGCDGKKVQRRRTDGLKVTCPVCGGSGFAPITNAWPQITWISPIWYSPSPNPNNPAWWPQVWCGDNPDVSGQAWGGTWPTTFTS